MLEEITMNSNKYVIDEYKEKADTEMNQTEFKEVWNKIIELYNSMNGLRVY